MREPGLILFDIDGTLTRSHGGFLPFNEAILETFGFSGDIRAVVPDGNTDLLILEDIFARCGLEAKITPEKWREFAANLRADYGRAIREGRTRIEAQPGASDLLRKLAGMNGFYQGVVTGNLEPIARLKLGAGGLDGYFHFGAYGSDSPRRADLPGIARERWERASGAAVAPERCLIVGDTPKDLDAARKNGMRCALVATGRYGMDELEARAPDACLADFRDTARAAETLLGLF